jgi:hypothetical protein
MMDDDYVVVVKRPQLTTTALKTGFQMVENPEDLKKIKQMKRTQNGSSDRVTNLL